MSQNNKQVKPYRIYNPTLHAMFGPLVKDGVITPNWGWISLANDQMAWREHCILTDPKTYDTLKTTFPEAQMHPVG